MIIVVNPKYNNLIDFVKAIPQTFSDSGECIYKERNEIRVIEKDGKQYVVKSFRKPHFFNRIIYTFIRASKAKRSYEHALKLLAKGIETPYPVAYLEERIQGVLSGSYFISVYHNYPGLLRELGFHPLEEVKELAEEFALFTAQLHEKEILHEDYSPGNILYEKTDQRYQFALIDINRMSFKPVDQQTAASNFRRLWGSEETISYIARIYARKRNFDEEKFIEETLSEHRKFWRFYRKKHPGATPVLY